MPPSKELERNMEDTEITLNGTDWSNLYIIDYAGGCGGEVMCDLISDKVDAQFSIPKSSTQSFAIDSFDNLYITPSLSRIIRSHCHSYRVSGVLQKILLVIHSIISLVMNFLK